MPSMNTARRQRWRSTLAEVRDSGWPCTTLDAPVVVYRNAGNSTLLHDNAHTCRSTNRSLTNPVAVTMTVDELLEHPKVCECVGVLSLPGTPGAWLNARRRLTVANSDIESVLSYPEWPREHTVGFAHGYVSEAAGIIQRSNLWELGSVLAHTRTQLDAARELVPRWRNDPRRLWWWATYLVYRDTHSTEDSDMLAPLRDGAAPDELGCPAELMERVVARIGNTDEHLWVLTGLPGSRYKDQCWNQFTVLELEHHTGHGMIGWFPDVAIETLTAPERPLMRSQRLDGVDAAGARYLAHVYDYPDELDTYIELARAASGTEPTRQLV